MGTNDGVCVHNASHCPDGEVAHADGSCHCPEGMHWSNDTNDGACVANTATSLAETGGDCWANQSKTESVCEGHHYDKKRCESIKWNRSGKPMCHWGPEMTHEMMMPRHPAPGGPCWANSPQTESICQGHNYTKEKCLSYKWRSTKKRMCHWNDTTQGTGCPAGEVQHADGSCHCPEGMHWSNDTNDGACVHNASHCPEGEVEHADGSCHCPEG